MTGLLPTQCYWRVSDCSTAYSPHLCYRRDQLLFYSPHSATGESVTVPLPTQYYKRVSDCSTAHTVLQEGQSLRLPTQFYRRVSDCSKAYSPHSARGGSVTSTAHTVLQESH